MLIEQKTSDIQYVGILLCHTGIDNYSCVCFGFHFRTVSTFHALLVGIFCLHILLFDDAVNEDPVW